MMIGIRGEKEGKLVSTGKSKRAIYSSTTLVRKENSIKVIGSSSESGTYEPEGGLAWCWYQQTLDGSFSARSRILQVKSSK